MSGGSWNYSFGQFDDVAERLARAKSPLRRALGKQVALIAKAMHDIEWVDSGDSSDDSEAIKAALGDKWHQGVLSELIMEAEETVNALQEMIAEARK